MRRTKYDIYLAGRIGYGQDHWRGQVAGDRFGGLDMDDMVNIGRWPKYEFLDGHYYTGPFFISDDHGCGHGPTQHGVNAAQKSCCFEGPQRAEVVRLCYRAIDDSDFVFAWLEPEAFGTLVEIGYAVGRNVPVYVAGPSVRDPEWWFACRSATVFDEADPVAAIRAAAAHFSKRFIRRGQ